MNKPTALLLLGPTGSGKTPLGELLHGQVLGGLVCHHFDFGAWLRRALESRVPVLSAAEVELIRQIYREGRLLDDELFYLADKILRYFMQQQEVSDSQLVILNGLPRHLGQALNMERIFSVAFVVELQCDSDTVQRRIRADSGGDRGERDDDEAELVRRKLEIFQTRTRPLIDHYASGNSVIIPLAINVTTRAADLQQILAQKLSG